MSSNLEDAEFNIYMEINSDLHGQSSNRSNGFILQYLQRSWSSSGRGSVYNNTVFQMTVNDGEIYVSQQRPIK